MDNFGHGLELSEGSHPRLAHCLITGNGQSGIVMFAKKERRRLHCKPILEHCVIVQNTEAALVGGEPVIVESMID